MMVAAVCHTLKRKSYLYLSNQWFSTGRVSEHVFLFVLNYFVCTELCPESENPNSLNETSLRPSFESRPTCLETKQLDEADWQRWWKHAVLLLYCFFLFSFIHLPVGGFLLWNSRTILLTRKHRLRCREK